MRKIAYILLLAFLPLSALAQMNFNFNSNSTQQNKEEKVETIVDRLKQGDSIPIYQGVVVKLDLMNSVLEPAMSRGRNQNYEASVSVRLKERFYPTLEGGYAHAEAEADGGHHFGRGGFGRVGIDINGLKKNSKTWDGLLVGIRIGTGLQNYQLTGVRLNDSEDTRFDYPTHFRADCWGEVVLGCQVNITKGLIMGWTARIKMLFTANDKHNGPVPYYIPGFGYRDTMNGGVNYYIGWKF